MRRSLLYITFLIISISCGSSKSAKNATTKKEDYKSIATQKLGEDVSYFMNEDGSFVLCTYEVAGTVQQPRNNIYYLVIKIADSSIALEDRVNGGTVSWFDKDEIEVYLTPGMVRKDQTVDDFKTLRNVITGKTREKGISETH